MNSAERRNKILELLKEKEEPVSASAMAKLFSVSRQIIVGDVAILRAASHAITATPRGYVLEKEKQDSSCFYTVACRHTLDTMGEELYAVVDQGGAVLNVIVEHPLYGQISGELQIFSRYDVDQFVKKLQKYQASPLSALTNGIHLHTLYCPTEEIFHRIRRELREKGILFSSEEIEMNFPWETEKISKNAE